MQPATLPAIVEVGLADGIRLSRLEPLLPSLDMPVDVSNTPDVLYWSAKKPIAKVKGWHQRQTRRVHNMSLSTLVSKLKADAFDRFLDTTREQDCLAAQTWHSFSAANGSKAVAAVRVLLGDAGLTLKQLVRSFAPEGLSLDLHSENVWIGGGGVSAWNHYDSSFNAFLQLHGTKRWLLTNPDVVEERLRPYSFLHPHFRRSQLHPEELLRRSSRSVNVSTGGEQGSSSNPSAANALTASALHEVWLQPGEALVLPPFTFHHVTATSDVSLAYNVWGIDQSTRRVQQLTAAAGAALGLSQSSLDPMSKEAKAACVEAVASSLVATVHKETALEEEEEEEEGRMWQRRLVSAREWLHKRMRDRWRPVLERTPSALNKLRRFCAPGKAATARAAMARTHMPSNVTSRVAEVAAAVSAMSSLPGKGVGKGSISLELGNLVEQLALDVLGDARTAGALLVWCFDDAPSTEAERAN